MYIAGEQLTDFVATCV